MIIKKKELRRRKSYFIVCVYLEQVIIKFNYLNYSLFFSLLNVSDRNFLTHKKILNYILSEWNACELIN